MSVPTVPTDLLRGHLIAYAIVGHVLVALITWDRGVFTQQNMGGVFN